MALLHAATLVAELGDFNRFETSQPVDGLSRTGAQQYTTGNDRQQGGITKDGQRAKARRALVEAAWQYRAPPA